MATAISMSRSAFQTVARRLTIDLPPLAYYQERLLSDQRREVATVSATQIGKTFVLALWLLVTAMRSKETRFPWWWLAPTRNQLQQGFEYIREFGRSVGLLNGEPREWPYPIVRLPGGRRIEFRSWDRPQNLAGTTILGGVVDEAGLLSMQAQAMISTRRSATLGPMRYIGNPGLTTGPFRKLCRKGENGEGNFSLHRWTWEDRHRWLESKDPERAAAYAEFIEEERSTLPEVEFRRLYQAEWTADESAVFHNVTDVTRGLPIDTPQAGRDYVIGVDCAQRQDYMVAMVLEADRTRARAVHMQRWRGLPYKQAVERLVALSDRWNRAPLIVEENGPGVAVCEELWQCRNRGYVAFTTTQQSKQEAILTLAADMEHDRIELAEMPPLQGELEMFRYQRTPSMLYRYSAPEGEHDDTVMALAIANWGRRQRGRVSVGVA